jgi:hypothetical protein
MAFPDQVKIGSQTWRIEYRLRSEDGMLSDGTYGYTLDSSNLIVVDYSNHFNKVQSTVLHEILHAARMTYDNNARPSKKADFAEVEHYFIGVWEPTLLQIIKDNPELLKWLTQK